MGLVRKFIVLNNGKYHIARRVLDPEGWMDIHSSYRLTQVTHFQVTPEKSKMTQEDSDAQLSSFVTKYSA